MTCRAKKLKRECPPVREMTIIAAWDRRGRMLLYQVSYCSGSTPRLRGLAQVHILILRRCCACGPKRVIRGRTTTTTTAIATAHDYYARRDEVSWDPSAAGPWASTLHRCSCRDKVAWPLRPLLARRLQAFCYVNLQANLWPGQLGQ